MARQMPKWEDDHSEPTGADVSRRGEHDRDKPAVARRRLLTGGGVVVAGAVGAGLAAAAAAPASAAAGGPVLQDTVNSAGTSATVTELDAANNTTPAFILTNTGIDTSTTPNGAGPALRLAPSTATVPAAATVGGDLTATANGDLWFTHHFGGTPPNVAAPVHTEATANVYAPLGAPVRILDTRSASGRASIVNPSGNLDSSGRLLAGKTIFINLDTLVFFGEAVFANVTVTGSPSSGFLTIWSGAGTRPIVSTIDWPSAGTTLANFLASAVAAQSTTVVNAIAIFANQTTHVILDVAGFMMPGFEFAKFTVGGAAAASRASRLQRAQQAIRAAARA
jgi:hypothetical protein